MSRVLAASLPGVWQGRRLPRDIPVIPTGHEALDRQLPSGGWPLGALTELLADTPGSGEFSLLLPILAELTSKARWAVLIDPPWLPYPPAMRGHGIALERLVLVRTRNAQEALWSCEQALQGIGGGVVIAWPGNPSFSRLRRLQLAASAGRKAAFLFRPPSAAAQASPAALRLQVSADPLGARITVLKCRGQRPEAPVLIRRRIQLPGSMLSAVGDAGETESVAAQGARAPRPVSVSSAGAKGRQKPV